MQARGWPHERLGPDPWRRRQSRGHRGAAWFAVGVWVGQSNGWFPFRSTSVRPAHRLGSDGFSSARGYVGLLRTGATRFERRPNDHPQATITGRYLFRRLSPTTGSRRKVRPPGGGSCGRAARPPARFSLLLRPLRSAVLILKEAGVGEVTRWRDRPSGMARSDEAGGQDPGMRGRHALGHVCLLLIPTQFFGTA